MGRTHTHTHTHGTARLQSSQVLCLKSSQVRVVVKVSYSTANGSSGKQRGAAGARWNRLHSNNRHKGRVAITLGSEAGC
jgi:hypothetical protein